MSQLEQWLIKEERVTDILLQIQVSSKSVIWKYIVNNLEKHIFNTLLNTASEEYLILNETGNLLRAWKTGPMQIVFWGTNMRPNQSL